MEVVTVILNLYEGQFKEQHETTWNNIKQQEQLRTTETIETAK